MHLTNSHVLNIGIVVVAIIVLFALAGLVSLSGADRRLLFSSKHHFQGRTYAVVKPKHINEHTKIILGLDGLGGSGKRFGYYTSLHNVDTNAIVIYPDPVPPNQKGQRPGWNAGFCCGSGWVQQIDDVSFLTNLTAHVAQEYRANDAKKFVVGFSNGAFMAHRLASEASDVFAAAAIVSGSVGTSKARIDSKKPVPVMLVHGVKDTIVPYAGGAGSSDASFIWLPFSETKQQWEVTNNQTAEVLVKIYPESGHSWFDWRTAKVWHKHPLLTDEVVKFFNNYN